MSQWVPAEQPHPTVWPVQESTYEHLPLQVFVFWQQVPFWVPVTVLPPLEQERPLLQPQVNVCPLLVKLPPQGAPAAPVAPKVEQVAAFWQVPVAVPLTTVPPDTHWNDESAQPQCSLEPSPASNARAFEQGLPVWPLAP